jgi:hypothetical protein
VLFFLLIIILKTKDDGCVCDNGYDDCSMKKNQVDCVDSWCFHGVQCAWHSKTATCGCPSAGKQTIVDSQPLFTTVEKGDCSSIETYAACVSSRDSGGLCYWHKYACHSAASLDWFEICNNTKKKKAPSYQHFSLHRGCDGIIVESACEQRVCEAPFARSRWEYEEFYENDDDEGWDQSFRVTRACVWQNNACKCSSKTTAHGVHSLIQDWADDDRISPPSEYKS